MPKRPVRYEKQKKARERALKERKALSYEDVPLEQYDQEEIKLKRPPKKVIRLLLILVLCSLAVILWANRESLSPQRVGNWFQNTLLGMGVGSGYPTPISGSEVQEGNFQLLDYQDAVVVSDTSFTYTMTALKNWPSVSIALALRYCEQTAAWRLFIIRRARESGLKAPRKP